MPTRISSDILIIGGGSAGMSASLAAAESGAKTIIVDDNPRLGGQIWRAELGRAKSKEAARLIDAIENGAINIVNDAQIFAASGANCLVAETPNGRTEFEYRKLVLATGARELFLPFPGWTLPNVFGAGGLQALVKGGLNIEKKRVIVAGTGALLLAVADYLKSKGAIITAVVEQASRAKVNKFAFGLWRSPSKLLQAAALRTKLLGVPYLTDCWITAAHGTEKLERIELNRKGKTRSVECDMLACGFHLVPNIELASLLGCRIEKGFVAVDAFQQTSCENIFCAGEPTGIAGVEASLIEGKIAGLAASGNADKAARFFAERDKARRFGESLNQAFELRNELRALAADDTIVCRCEDVEYGRMKGYTSFRAAKLQTRCGMGSCRGRVCGAATEFLFGWEPDTSRPPIFPVRMENL